MKRNNYYHSEINVKDNKNWPIIKVTQAQIEIIKRYNNSKTLEEKIQYGEQLPIELFAVCRFCGKRIINLNFHINVSNDEAHHTFPSVYSRTINEKEYILSCCEKCLLEHFKNDPPKSSKYYFMKANRFGMYSFGYSYDEYKQITSMTTGVTQKSMIRKWGHDEGLKRWDDYCKKQAETNTFEYKNKKYGMTKEEFDKFNRSRAVTYENLLNKYKDPNKAKEAYDNYINEQKRTKSLTYMIEKFGIDKANEINSQKALTLKNFIRKYGDVDGEIKYKEYLSKHKNYYSKLSQICFNEIDHLILKKYNYKTYYATKNREFGLKIGEQYVCLDYFIKDLNICIEFNGDYFHGNPKIFKETDYPNPYDKKTTAKEIWENDKLRYTKLKEIYGINTYVIWENDYKNNFNVEDFIINTLKINIL